MFCSAASVRPEQQPPPIKIMEAQRHEMKKRADERRLDVSSSGQSSGEPSAPPSPSAVSAKVVNEPMKPTATLPASSPPGEIVSKEPPSSTTLTYTASTTDFACLLRTFLFSLGNIASIDPDPCPSSSGPRRLPEEEEEEEEGKGKKDGTEEEEMDPEGSADPRRLGCEDCSKARPDRGAATTPGAVAVSGIASAAARQAEVWRKAAALADDAPKAAGGGGPDGKGNDDVRDENKGGNSSSSSSSSSSAPMEAQFTSCTRTTCTQMTTGDDDDEAEEGGGGDDADIVTPLFRSEDRHLSSWDKLDRHVLYQPLSTASAASCYDFAGATHPPRSSHRRPSSSSGGGGKRRHSLPAAPSKASVVAAPAVLSSLVPNPVKHHHIHLCQHHHHPHPTATTIVDDRRRGRYLSLHTSGTESTAGRARGPSSSLEGDLGRRPGKDDDDDDVARRKRPAAAAAATAARRARDALRRARARACGEYHPLESGDSSGASRRAKPPPPRRKSVAKTPPGLRGCGRFVGGGAAADHRRMSVASAPSTHERGRRRRRGSRGSASTVLPLTDESSSSGGADEPRTTDQGTAAQAATAATPRVLDPVGHSGERRRPPLSTTSRRRKSFELTPGRMVELRGADETMEALRDCRTVLVQCAACSTTLACVADADMVICPECRLVGPNVPPDAWLAWGDGDRAPGRGRPLFAEDEEEVDGEDDDDVRLARGAAASAADGKEWKEGEKVRFGHVVAASTSAAASRSRLLWTQFGKSSRNVGGRQRQPQQQQPPQPRRRRRSCPEIDMKRAGGVGLGLKV